MRAAAVYCLAALLTVLPCRATAGKSSAGYVQLKLEERTTLHVGQTAVLMMPSPGHFRIGSAGKALAPIERTQREGPIFYLYRAARPGDEVILVTPIASEMPADGCISCVTRHYFVTVLP